MNAQPMGSEDAAALLAFERSLRWRHARGRGGAAALRLLLAFVVPVALAAWLLPDLRLWLLGALLAGTLAAAAIGAFRGHHTATAALLRPGIDVRGDGELANLGDELTTWLELHRGRREHLLLPWLGREVAAQLPSMEAGRLRQVGRGRFARWRWLLPLLFVLVVAWFLAEWLSPPWRGLLGGGPTEPPPPPAGSTPQPQPSPGGGGEIEQPQRRQPNGQPPPPPPADQDNPSPPPEPDGPPPPLLDLPAQQRFLIPEFANDGPTRRVRMHAAETEQGAPIAPQPTRASQGERAPLPPPSAEQFRRAEEQALQSRHVPEHERAMVRRFFQALREAAK